METIYSLHACNCSVFPIRGTVFPNLHELASTSAVWLANVTSSTTVSVKGVPFTTYNIANIETLHSLGSYEAPPGTVAEIAWLGGTVNGTTMNPVGYPTLKVGGTYVFFIGPYSFVPNATSLSTWPDPFGEYWGGFDGGMAYGTTGGPQGLFCVQDGKVYSLDNLYPQDDSWLPVKVNGEPLSQFISDIQSA